MVTTKYPAVFHRSITTQAMRDNMIRLILRPIDACLDLWFAFIQTHLAKTVITSIYLNTFRFRKCSAFILCQNLLSLTHCVFKERLAHDPIAHLNIATRLLPVV